MKRTNMHTLMGEANIKTLNELFLQAVAAHDKPDCFLVKKEGRYQGISSQEALRKVAALASVFAISESSAATAWPFSPKTASSGR